MSYLENEVHFFLLLFAEVTSSLFFSSLRLCFDLTYWLSFYTLKYLQSTFDMSVTSHRVSEHDNKSFLNTAVFNTKESINSCNSLIQSFKYLRSSIKSWLCFIIK